MISVLISNIFNLDLECVDLDLDLDLGQSDLGCPDLEPNTDVHVHCDCIRERSDQVGKISFGTVTLSMLEFLQADHFTAMGTKTMLPQSHPLIKMEAMSLCFLCLLYRFQGRI